MKKSCISDRLITDMMHDLSSKFSIICMGLSMMEEGSVIDHEIISTVKNATQKVRIQIEYYKALCFNDLSKFFDIASSYMNEFNVKIDFLQTFSSINFDHNLVSDNCALSLDVSSRDDMNCLIANQYYDIYRAIMYVFLFLAKRGIKNSNIKIVEEIKNNQKLWMIHIDNNSVFRQNEIDTINKIFEMERINIDHLDDDENYCNILLSYIICCINICLHSKFIMRIEGHSNMTHISFFQCND